MTDLGWRARSSQLARKAKPIEGLRDDFGLRVKTAVEAMKEEGPNRRSQEPKGSTGALFSSENKGVNERAKRDLAQLETADTREVKRQAALERKADLYDRLQRGVDLEDEATNDQREVDFIAKALAQDKASLPPASDRPELRRFTAGPEMIIEQQRAARVQMQGGANEEYSTYDEDVADTEARHRRVDELNALNAERNAQFEEERRQQAERNIRKKQESAKHKDAVLQRLLGKQNKVKS